LQTEKNFSGVHAAGKMIETISPLCGELCEATPRLNYLEVNYYG